MERIALLALGILGFLAIALGAFGAHGLKSKLAPLADGAQRLEWWNTGAHYHLMHALALGLVAYLASRSSSSAVTLATAAFVLGIMIFSGILYTMTLTRTRWLGAITPLGGVAFLVGWASIAYVAWGLAQK